VQQVKAGLDTCKMYCDLAIKSNNNAPQDCLSDSHCPDGEDLQVSVL